MDEDQDAFEALFGLDENAAADDGRDDEDEAEAAHVQTDADLAAVTLDRVGVTVDGRVDIDPDAVHDASTLVYCELEPIGCEKAIARQALEFDEDMSVDLECEEDEGAPLVATPQPMPTPGKAEPTGSIDISKAVSSLCDIDSATQAAVGKSFADEYMTTWGHLHTTTDFISSEFAQCMRRQNNVSHSRKLENRTSAYPGCSIVAVWSRKYLTTFLSVSVVEDGGVPVLCTPEVCRRIGGSYSINTHSVVLDRLVVYAEDDAGVRTVVHSSTDPAEQCFHPALSVRTGGDRRYVFSPLLPDHTIAYGCPDVLDAAMDPSLYVPSSALHDPPSFAWPTPDGVPTSGTLHDLRNMYNLGESTAPESDMVPNDTYRVEVIDVSVPLQIGSRMCYSSGYFRERLASLGVTLEQCVQNRIWIDARVFFYEGLDHEPAKILAGTSESTAVVHKLSELAGPRETLVRRVLLNASRNEIESLFGPQPCERDGPVGEAQTGSASADKPFEGFEPVLNSDGATIHDPSTYALADADQSGRVVGKGTCTGRSMRQYLIDNQNYSEFTQSVTAPLVIAVTIPQGVTRPKFEVSVFSNQGKRNGTHTVVVLNSQGTRGLSDAIEGAIVVYFAERKVCVDIVRMFIALGLRRGLLDLVAPVEEGDEVSHHVREAFVAAVQRRWSELDVKDILEGEILFEDHDAEPDLHSMRFEVLKDIFLQASGSDMARENARVAVRIDESKGLGQGDADGGVKATAAKQRKDHERNMVQSAKRRINNLFPHCLASDETDGCEFETKPYERMAYFLARATYEGLRAYVTGTGGTRYYEMYNRRWRTLSWSLATIVESSMYMQIKDVENKFLGVRTHSALSPEFTKASAGLRNCGLVISRDIERYFKTQRTVGLETSDGATRPDDAANELDRRSAGHSNKIAMGASGQQDLKPRRATHEAEDMMDTPESSGSIGLTTGNAIGAQVTVRNLGSFAQFAFDYLRLHVGQHFFTPNDAVVARIGPCRHDYYEVQVDAKCIGFVLADEAVLSCAMGALKALKRMRVAMARADLHQIRDLAFAASRVAAHSYSPTMVLPNDSTPCNLIDICGRIVYATKHDHGHTQFAMCSAVVIPERRVLSISSAQCRPVRPLLRVHTVRYDLSAPDGTLTVRRVDLGPCARLAGMSTPTLQSSVFLRTAEALRGVDGIEPPTERDDRINVSVHHKQCGNVNVFSMPRDLDVGTWASIVERMVTAGFKKNGPHSFLCNTWSLYMREPSLTLDSYAHFLKSSRRAVVHNIDKLVGDARTLLRHQGPPVVTNLRMKTEDSEIDLGSVDVGALAGGLFGLCTVCGFDLHSNHGGVAIVSPRRADGKKIATGSKFVSAFAALTSSSVLQRFVEATGASWNAKGNASLGTTVSIAPEERLQDSILLVRKLYTPDKVYYEQLWVPPLTQRVWEHIFDRFNLVMESTSLVPEGQASCSWHEPGALRTVYVRQGTLRRGYHVFSRSEFDLETLIEEGAVEFVDPAEEHFHRERLFTACSPESTKDQFRLTVAAEVAQLNTVRGVPGAPPALFTYMEPMIDLKLGVATACHPGSNLEHAARVIYSRSHTMSAIGHIGRLEDETTKVYNNVPQRAHSLVVTPTQHMLFMRGTVRTTGHVVWMSHTTSMRCPEDSNVVGEHASLFMRHTRVHRVSFAERVGSNGRLHLVGKRMPSVIRTGAPEAPIGGAGAGAGAAHDARGGVAARAGVRPRARTRRPRAAEHDPYAIPYQPTADAHARDGGGNPVPVVRADAAWVSALEDKYAEFMQTYVPRGGWTMDSTFPDPTDDVMRRWAEEGDATSAATAGWHGTNVANFRDAVSPYVLRRNSYVTPGTVLGLSYEMSFSHSQEVVGERGMADGNGRQGAATRAVIDVKEIKAPPGVCGVVRNLRISRTKDGSNGRGRVDRGGRASGVEPFDTYVFTWEIEEVASLDNGDKFASDHGQKNTTGFQNPSWLMPFSSDGTRPDVITGAVTTITRMTMGEHIDGAEGLTIVAPHGEMIRFLNGPTYLQKCIDNGTGVDTLADVAERAVSRFGIFRDMRAFQKTRLGAEGTPMYWNLGKRIDSRNAFTGEPTGLDLIPTSFKKLDHCARMKLGYRVDTGATDVATGQPENGRSRHGGRKSGEMEFRAVHSHGADTLLRSFIRSHSSGMVYVFCTVCGTPADVGNNGEARAPHKPGSFETYKDVNPRRFGRYDGEHENDLCAEVAADIKSGKLTAWCPKCRSRRFKSFVAACVPQASFNILFHYTRLMGIGVHAEFSR